MGSFQTSDNKNFLAPHTDSFYLSIVSFPLDTNNRESMKSLIELLRTDLIQFI